MTMIVNKEYTVKLAINGSQDPVDPVGTLRFHGFTVIGENGEEFFVDFQDLANGRQVDEKFDVTILWRLSEFYKSQFLKVIGEKL